MVWEFIRGCAITIMVFITKTRSNAYQKSQVHIFSFLKSLICFHELAFCNAWSMQIWWLIFVKDFWERSKLLSRVIIIQSKPLTHFWHPTTRRSNHLKYFTKDVHRTTFVEELLPDEQIVVWNCGVFSSRRNFRR